jgi:tRNA-dihydrouridine synthase A
MIFGQQPVDCTSRIAMLHRIYPYIEKQLSQGMPLRHMVRHLIGLFHGEPNGRRWRRYLSENAYIKGAGIETLRQAERLVS